MKFILDTTAIPEIVTLYQTFGREVLDIVYHMTRTFAYGIHRKKLILTGRWPYATKHQNCYDVVTNDLFFAGTAGGPGDHRPGKVTTVEELPDAQAGTEVPLISLGSRLLSCGGRNGVPADAEQILLSGNIVSLPRNGLSFTNEKLDNNLGSPGCGDYGAAPCCQRLTDVQHDHGLHACSGGFVGAVRGWLDGEVGPMAIDSFQASKI